MIILEDKSDAEYQIDNYESHKITINEKTYTHSLILTPNVLITDWQPQSLAELKISDLPIVLQFNPKIVLLATGEHFKIVSPEIIDFFQARAIGIECMNTGAVCRTYTALISEGRKVVAIIFLK